MPRNSSDISNTAVRIFLQEMGKAYDLRRGLTPYKKKDFRLVKEYFEDECCFCGVSDVDFRLTGDHLVPMNKKSLGLEAWGNIVPACGDCNEKKTNKEWEAFLSSTVSSTIVRQKRSEKIRQFVKHYGYFPELTSLRIAVEELYEESGSIAMRLIELKVARALERSSREDLP